MDEDAKVRAADPRPARTRAAIYAAAATLTSQPGGEVSVNAIIRAAGISRGGFYSHFSNLDDLLISMLIDAFRGIAADHDAVLHAPDADPAQAARAAQERLVAFVIARRHFFHTSLNWQASSRAHETIVQAYAEGVEAAIVAHGDTAPPHVDVHDLATFIAGGAVALLTRWVREEDHDTPQEVVVDRLLAVMPDWLVGRS